MGKVVSELDTLRAYNASLADVAKAASAEELVPGVGPVSVFGGCTYSNLVTLTTVHVC